MASASMAGPAGARAWLRCLFWARTTPSSLSHRMTTQEQAMARCHDFPSNAYPSGGGRDQHAEPDEEMGDKKGRVTDGSSTADPGEIDESCIG